MKFLLLSLVCFCGAWVIRAQNHLPTVRATQTLVDIRDGGVLSQGAWTVVTSISPDVYITTQKKGKVTFYTDIDSISIRINPKKPVDFIILVNDTGRALTQVKYQSGFLDVLKEGSRYNKADNRPVPAFTYQDKNFPALVALRNGFQLDSIAGTGNQTSQVLNLLHWVHNLIPHDGEHSNPEVKNAMNLIAQCKKEERGLNCRGLATVLNECYLAMGFKSRFVTCLPKDSNDTECHVINMVYVDELGKWMWVDPTHDSYLMDEKGNVLGIDEVRSRLINHQPLILNPDANWNHRSSSVKAYYIEQYMAKNLYRFECPVVSQYDTETPAKGKKIEYVELVPLDYYRQKPDVSTFTSTTTGITYVTYLTNNPQLFWAKP